VDYVPEEVAAAFDGIYDIAGLSESAGESENIEGCGHNVVSSGSEPQANREPSVRPAGPDIWVELGEAVVQETSKRRSDFEDSPLFVDWDDSGFWVAIGDSVIEEIDANISDSRDSIDTAEFSRLAVEVLTGYAEEYGGDEGWAFLDTLVSEFALEQWSGIEEGEEVSADGVTWEEYKQEYFEPAWDDHRETPVELNKPEPAKVADETRDAWVRIKAEYYPVKYKALGRQFYREVLSDKQRLAYDI
jgi:hypothetical protein